jgi:hypothetical protein
MQRKEIIYASLRGTFFEESLSTGIWIKMAAKREPFTRGLDSPTGK